MSPWQIIGTSSLLATLIGGLVILLRNPTQTTESISYHIASKKHYFVLMGLALTFAGLAFYGFLIFWLIPTYELPHFTRWIVIGSFIAQLCVAWLPAKPDTLMGKVHMVAGVLIGTAMVVCLWILIMYGHNLPETTSTIARVAAICTPIFYALLSIGMLKIKQLVLPSEVLMITVFSVAILALCWKI